MQIEKPKVFFIKIKKGFHDLSSVQGKCLQTIYIPCKFRYT